MEPLKIFDVGMLAFVFGLQALGGIALLFMLNGCSSKNTVIDSLIYDQRPSNMSIIVEKPPIRIIYTGPVTDKGIELTEMAISKAQSEPYRNYQFNDTFRKDVVVGFGRKEIDSDTNSMTVNK